MTSAKMRVRFLEDREVRDGQGRLLAAYQVGDEVKLPLASARRWLRRGVAEAVDLAGSAPEASARVPSSGDPLPGESPGSGAGGAETGSPSPGSGPEGGSSSPGADPASAPKT